MCEHFIARASEPFRLDDLWPFAERLERFGQRLPDVRKAVAERLRGSGLGRERVLAGILRLLEIAHFRLGAERGAASTITGNAERSAYLTARSASRSSTAATKITAPSPASSASVRSRPSASPPSSRTTKRIASSSPEPARPRARVMPVAT